MTSIPYLHHRLDGPDDAPVLVFSNSLGTDFRVWDTLFPLLSPGWRFLRYDKRGHGLSDLPNGQWGMDHHVQDLEYLLDRYKIDNFVLCGLSVGGIIAQAIAAKRPAAVRALILMDTAAKIGGPELWNPRIKAVRTTGLESLADAVMTRWFTKSFRETAAEFPKWRNMLVRTTAEGYAKTCEALRDTDLSASTKSLNVPTLAIVGEDDGSTTPDMVRATADLIPNAQFEIIKDAGHIPCVEQPQVTADLINRFLMNLPA